MATRFWLTSSAPPYTPATRRGSWAVASGEDIQYLGRKPAGTAGSSTINVGSTAANRDVLLHRSISDGAVKAGTLSGTVNWVIGAKESNAACNAFFHLHIYVTSGDSDTPRGTLLTDNIGATEFGTTAIGASEGAKAVTSVAVQVGDRIVVEIGYRASASATTQNATVNYGNTGTTDLSIASASVTSQPGWIEFSGADGLFTKSLSTLTDAFPSTIDAKWTASAGVSATGGRARINCTTAVPNMFTAAPYEIQASALAFKVPTVPVAGGGSTVTFSGYLMPSAGSTTNLEFEYSPNAGNLVLRNSVGGTDASPTTLTYSATDHLWWRFKDNGSGSVLMETSPDNSTWTTRRTVVMSQWMLQGSVVAYFEAGRASGTADYAEIDDINPPTGQTAALTLASETDTAQALAKSKTKALTLSSATETAQGLGRTKRLTLGVASESSTGQVLARTKRTTPGIAAETDAARAPGKVTPVTLAAETGIAQALGRRKTAALGTASETGAAQTPGRGKQLTASQAAATDTARPVTSTKVRALGTAIEQGTVPNLTATKTLTIGTAGDTGTASAITANKATALAPAASTDTAQSLTATRIYALSPTAETATAQPIITTKTASLHQAEEDSAALSITGATSQQLGRATETNTAQTIGRTKRLALTLAAETGTAVPLTTPDVTAQPLTPANESGAAQPLAPTKTLALGPAYEYGTALPLGAAKTKPTAYATETSQAKPLTAVRRLTLTPAVETNIACGPDGLTKRRLIGPVTETNTAQALTSPGAGLTHGIRLTGGPRTVWAAPSQPVTAWASHATATAWTCTRNEVPVHSLTTEFHEVGVTWTRGDPTTATVQMAVVPHGHEPDDADWHTAAWDTDADGLTVAKILVGPEGGAVDPGPGRYRDWVSIDAPPEHPVLATPPYDIT